MAVGVPFTTLRYQGVGEVTAGKFPPPLNLFSPSSHVRSVSGIKTTAFFDTKAKLPPLVFLHINFSIIKARGNGFPLKTLPSNEGYQALPFQKCLQPF
jgi:hypothetical protein